MKGEVRIEQTLEEDAIFEPGQRVILTAASGALKRESPAYMGEASRKGIERETEIEYFRRQHGRCIVKLRAIDSISEDEKYIGHEIKIPADALPAPREGWFYTFQLKGCRVFTTRGQYIGTVTDVLDTGGNEILKVDYDQVETLIPFAREYMKRIDPDQHMIEVELPEDLRDLNK